MSEAGEGQQEPPSGSSPPAPAPPEAPAAALREDQVQNAVAFMSHPKVRSSPISSKRDFLRGKGLTEVEIDEAFRRVPEQPAAAPAPPAATSVPASSGALQSTLQHIQPQAMAQQQPQGYGQPVPAGAMVVHQPQQASGVRWTQVVLGVGFLSASAYAAKALLWPYMEDAITSWRGRVRPPSRPRSSNGTDAAESAEATRLVAEAIQAQTAELRTSIESIKQLAGSLEASKQAAAEAPGSSQVAAADGSLTVADLRSELRSFAEALHGSAPSPAASAAGGGVKVESELGEIKALLAEILRSPRSEGRSRSPGKDAAAGAALTPASVTSVPRTYASAAAAAPQTEHASSRPADTQQAAGSPGDAAATPTPGPAAAEPTEASQQQQNGADPPGPASTPAAAGGAAAAPAAEAMQPPPHPASYLEVLEMLEKGETPPGIRTDINDKPPNPHAEPAPSKLKPRPKPWEQRSMANAGGSSGSLASLGAGSSAGAAPRSTPAAVGQGDSTSAPEASAAAAAAASPATPARHPAAGEDSVELPPPALSPVRVSSPLEEVPPEWQPTQQAEAQGRAQQPQQAQQAEQRSSPSRASSFKSPSRPAASIFEAVAPAPDSPNIITGRFSPNSRAGSMARSGSSSSLSQPQPQQQQHRLASGAGSTGASVSSNQAAPASSFGALLAAAEERASAAAAAGGGEPVLEGSGIGRPISRNWKPPPIPVSTLSGSAGGSSKASSVDGAGAAPAATSPLGAAAAPVLHPAVAALAGEARGLEASGKAPSSDSLGADFAAA